MIVEIQDKKVKIGRGNPETEPYCLLVNAMGIETLYCFADIKSRQEFYESKYQKFALSGIVKCKKYFYGYSK